MENSSMIVSENKTNIIHKSVILTLFFTFCYKIFDVLVFSGVSAYRFEGILLSWQQDDGAASLILRQPRQTGMRGG